MSNVYTHSDTFASLKNIKEEVRESLTTAQWLQTLDYLLESSIDPIVTANTDLADNFFAKVVAWQGHKPSIKFSRNDKTTLPVALFNSLTTQGAEKRLHQKSMLLNRGLLFGLVAIFLRTVNNYKRLHDPALKMGRSRRLLLIQQAESRVKSTHLYAAIMQVEYFSSKAHWFKELIMQKYTRLALMNAKRTYKAVGYAQRLDDIVQVYLIFLSRAIDRCDSRQGVLTTFIQTWFYSARSEVQKSCVESQHTSYEEMLENGIHHLTTEADHGYEAVQHLAYAAKQVDTVGILRFSLGIPEFFSKKDLKKLEIFTTTTK